MIPRPTATRRAGGWRSREWIGSPQNPLTARVIVNRLWHQHFGRGIVATLDNFGKMGEQPTHPGAARLAGRRVHEARLEHQADQQADDDVRGLPDGVGASITAAMRRRDPENRYLWRYRPQRLDAEIVRDSDAGGRRQHQPDDGREPIFPFIPKDILVTEYRGKWENTPDGPATWRRSVYVYRGARCRIRCSTRSIIPT